MRELILAYPELAALLVLVLGVVLGKIAEVIVRRVLGTGARLIARYGGRKGYALSPMFQQGFSVLVFAAVLVIAAILAVRLLDIPQLTAWLDAILVYVPRLFLALIIIGMGNVLGVLLRNVTAGVITQGEGNGLLPVLVHVGVVIVAVITGLQQLGIDISFVTHLSLIVLAAVLGGLSIAFALGARQYVANLLAQAETARYATGERLRIDGDEGVIVEIYRTGLTLATDEGLVSIPASRLASERVVRLGDDAPGE